jgi:hypothetical protein
MQSKAWTNIRPGMFSVWNWDNGQYDYYKAPLGATPRYGDVVKPPPIQALSGGVGEDPDTSGRVLPYGSKLVGSGDAALGEIVSASSNFGSIPQWVIVPLVIAAPIVLLLTITKIKDLIFPEEL